ncbi:hypothetical protein EOD41_05535 [Mucilaginibacter limnophilus]|uniref:Uncharacterized protein n=1 Tax=Mucilaginibacter limnophilus TaxID=1932778 RepID=A0A3S2Y3Y2_9SPHI|nr:hypothetical protein [Mucilaginibacter limnophilus]RVU01425.1 hypothetical protein EOD41_05535 [Mucilaginibacter limnophilus]
MASTNKGYPGVTKAQLEKLVANYRRSIKKTRKGSLQPIDHDAKRDSNSVWFSRASVEELFKANNADGLRVYFAVHDNETMATEYDDMLTVILVATKNNGRGKDEDQIFDKEDTNEKALTGTDPIGGGSGLNHGKICPPANCP